MAHILLIDDSAFARNQIGRILKKAGHSYLEADNGISGLKALVSQPFDCIITDMLMPEMDGLRFLTMVRERKLVVPIVVLTADVQSKTREEALALGALAVINKPPVEAGLLAALEQALAAKG